MNKRLKRNYGLVLLMAIGVLTLILLVIAYAINYFFGIGSKEQLNNVITIVRPFIYLIIYVYILDVLDRADTPSWRYLWGSTGMILFYMIWLQKLVAVPVSNCITTLSGIIGNATGYFTAYYSYSAIFVKSMVQSMLLQIDVDCSGSIEIGVFISLLVFFRVYDVAERFLIAVIGTMYIIFANAIRVSIICIAVYYGGYGAYNVVHSYVGRVIFYLLSILLYFEVFTRGQISNMKVGNFSYDLKKKTSKDGEGSDK
jgi:exosortase family protein XrtG